MSDLLIHSMAEFAPLIGPALDRAGVRTIAEIGAEFGGMSRFLADYCEGAGGTLTCIDPEPKPEFTDWVASAAHVAHVSLPSLEAFGHLSEVDAWVIDGDHNYYTVYNELLEIDQIAQRDGTPLLAFLHDVGWPCARRDMYYAPDRIPQEHRHPYSYEDGVHVDTSAVLRDAGFRGRGQFAIAQQLGGPANGVLTAVEDFLARANTAERPLIYAHVPAVFGLGVIMDASAEWAEDLAGIFLPFHENPLVASLELNRLRNYLAVIEWQDRTANGR